MADSKNAVVAIDRLNCLDEYPLKGRDGLTVSGSTRVIGGDSSPIPAGGCSQLNGNPLTPFKTPPALGIVCPPAGRGELAVSGSTRVIGGDSSPIPAGGFTFPGKGNLELTFPGKGRLELPEALWGAGGGTARGGGGASYSIYTWNQVRIFEDKTFETKEKARQYWKGRLAEALVGCGRGSEAECVAHCAEDFKVGKCLDCGASPAFPISCGHRLCPDCASRRGKRLVEEHSDILKRLHYPKMLTLTFVSVEHIDKAYIRWARRCFTKLRRRKVMRGCWGGIYSFEATYTEGVGWHLHIHALIGSSYIKQAELSEEWKGITGACVVDIRAVKGKDKWNKVREVVKYPSKVATFLDKPNLVDEFLLATEGVNLAYGFGAMYRVKTRRHGEDKMRCPLCGGVDISWAEGYGFCVPRIAVERVKGGWLWHPPPAPALVEIDMEV